MAVLKFAGKHDTPHPKIKTQEHFANVFDYATKEEKTDLKLTAYINCSHNDRYVLKEFQNDRIAYSQDKGILASHIVQSFSPSDNVTPELAHKIGREFLEKCAADYKAILITHVDRNHIHNHIIVNSCSMLDGKKFYENKTHLRLLRKVSDELCYKYGLSVIEKDNATKYYPLDQSTLNAAKEGRSWKFQLVKDMDKAFEDCHSKNEFINFFQTHGYEIKFTNKNITFKKIGEQKGIRADTLAKQFGQKYSKASIEQRMNITAPPSESARTGSKKFITPNYDYYNQLAAVNWKRYEKKYAESIKVKNPQLGSINVFTKNPFLFSLRLIRYILNLKGQINHAPKRKIKTYSSIAPSRSFIDYKHGKKVLGNISYKQIVNSFGESVQIKLYAWQITHLLNHNILLSSRIDLRTGTAVVTLKKTDLYRVAAILGVPSENFRQQAEKINNRKITAELRKKNLKLSYLVVTPEQANALKEHCVLFAQYPKGEKLNIAFAPEDKEKVLNVLFPNREEKKVNKETFFQRNAALNRELKETAKETGEKLCYKVITPEQFSVLKKQLTMEKVAAFRKTDGKVNLVFLESQAATVEKALGGITSKRRLSNGNAQIKL